MTVDGFFEFWMNHLIPDLRSNTKRNYRDRYIHNIQPVVGKLKVGDVRPFHCKKVLLDMEEDYSPSTVVQTYIAMGTLFKAARENGVINKHPMDGVKCPTARKSMSDIKVLTVEEQTKLLEVVKRSHNYDQYVLLLQTGLRTIERQIPPKTLQRLLGHASLQVTMDTYVHVTENTKIEAIKQFEKNEPESLKMVQWCKTFHQNGVKMV